MNKTGAGILTLAVMLALILGSGSRSESSSTSAGNARPESGTERTSRKSRTEARAAAQSCGITEDTIQFKLIDAIRTSFSRGTTIDDQCAEDFQIEESQANRANVVFAILPDPVHTHLSLLFDRQIDAIRQGIMDSRWIFERALMPWDNKDHPESDDFSIRLQQEVYEAHQEDQPGLMIFRRAPDKDDPDPDPIRLLVFIISESPTTGVQKTQFRQAVSMVQHLFKASLPKKFPIFGPTFSGSLQSLQALMDCKDQQDFPCTAARSARSVYSGTITNAGSIQHFRNKASIPFFTLQENDDYVLKVFLDFARDTWHYSNEQIAILSEDETVYGAKGMRKEGERREARDKPPASGEVSRSTEYPGPTGTQDAADAESNLVHVYFPREISQLRSAYQHNLSAPATTDDKTPRRTLPLDLESSGSDDYTVPGYARRQYPLSQEAILLGLVGELAKHDVQIILLRATDPLDQFFLSRYLRQAYPSGRIITVSSDLLFSREVEDARLHGVMALTTYTLTPGADHEFQDSGCGHSDRVFPSTHSAGSYNAMKLLLANNFPLKRRDPTATPDPCDESAQPTSENQDKNSLPRVHLYEYGWPEKKTAAHPPVHLTVLGRDGYWRVAVLPSDPDGNNKVGTAIASSGLEPVRGSSLPPIDNPQRSEEADLDKSAPAIWNLLWITAIALSLGYVYFMWSASTLSSSQAIAQLAPTSGSSAYRRNGERGPSPWQYHSRRYLLAAAAYLHFAVLLALLWPYKYGSHTFSLWPRRFLVLALFLVLIVGTCDLWRRNCRRIALQFALACIVTVVVFLFVNIYMKDYFHQMAVYRSFHLSSGVSLLFSILLFLTAGLWGVWYSLSGTSLLDSSRTVLPKKEEINKAALDDSVRQELHAHRAILEEDQSRLVQLLRPDTFDKRVVISCALVAVAALFFTSFRPIRSLEPGFHEYVLTAMAVCSFTFLLEGLFRLYNIWIELRRLLIALDSSPLRRGFRRLKGLSWSPLWRMGGGNLGDFRRLLNRQGEAWRCVFNRNTTKFTTVEQQLNDQGTKTFHQYEIAMDHYLGRQRRPATDHDPGRDRKRSRFTALLDRLTFGWSRRIREQREEEIKLLAETEELQQQFATVGLHTLALAVTEWDDATTLAYDGTEDSPSSASADASDPAGKPAANKFAIRDAAEQFLALLYTSFIMIVLVRIRTLIMTIGGMYVLSLLALTTYPFQPQVPIRTFLLLVLIFMVAVVGVVYAQMHRDATLSHITNTERQLGGVFWLRIASFIALPVFSLLASQYPGIGNMFSSWLQPALNALK